MWSESYEIWVDQNEVKYLAIFDNDADQLEHLFEIACNNADEQIDELVEEFKDGVDPMCFPAKRFQSGDDEDVYKELTRSGVCLIIG